MTDFLLLAVDDAAVFYTADPTPAGDIQANRDAVRSRAEDFVRARRADLTLAPEAPFLVIVDFVFHPSAVAVFKAEALAEDAAFGLVARALQDSGPDGAPTRAVFSGDAPFPRIA